MMTRRSGWLATALLVGTACGPKDEEAAFIDVPCVADQPAPYPRDMPYVGIHANAANDDVVPCEVADRFGRAWHALEGHAVMQPATLSPDGGTVYVTATDPDPDGCTLYALDAADGSTRWCEALPFDVVASAAEVDAEGRVIVSAGGRLYAFDGSGGSLWTSPLWTGPDPVTDAEYARHTGYGVHFLATGEVVTLTAAGRIVLVDRTNGDRVAELDLVEAFGLVPAEASMLSGFDLLPLLPPEVVSDIEGMFGERAAAVLESFFGASGNVSDNTIAVSSRGELYAIVAGTAEDLGALVQVRIEGGALVPGWIVETRPGSAATPSITPDGRWVVSSDGSATRSLMDLESADATVFGVDVDACDANTDADPEPLRCGVAWVHALTRGPMPGAPGLTADGTAWLYELGMSLDSDPAAADVVAAGPDGVRLSVPLPEGAEWTSVMTLTEGRIVGTMSRIEPSEEKLAGLTLPRTVEDELVVLSQADGAVLFSAPIPDDSAATVSVGPDGSLYVGMLGLVSMLATDERPTLGLIRFRPTE